MSILKKAKVAAVVHKQVDLFIDLIGDMSRKRNEREAADKVLYLAKARILMDLVRLTGVSLN